MTTNAGSDRCSDHLHTRIHCSLALRLKDAPLTITNSSQSHSNYSEVGEDPIVIAYYLETVVGVLMIVSSLYLRRPVVLEGFPMVQLDVWKVINGVELILSTWLLAPSDILFCYNVACEPKQVAHPCVKAVTKNEVSSYFTKSSRKPVRSMAEGRDYFSKPSDAIGKGQGERFLRDIKEMERRCQGKWIKSMIAVSTGL
ncbi:hypothetical protein TNCV_3410201 [Trichonephila clavipes]|nr:hypothetical protein TNCV_3410201 [Trichonephila clavipes]